MGRSLVILGLALVVAGLLVSAGARWPIFGKLGRLPGDFTVDRPGFKFYFPLTTSILVSVVLTLLLALFRKR
jgi:hypothetical protein